MVRCPFCLVEQQAAPSCRSCGATLEYDPPPQSFNPYAAPLASGELLDAARPGHYDVLAGRSARFGAKLLDGLLSMLAALPGFLVLALAANARNPPLFAFALIVGGMLALNIYQWVLLSNDGQTIGKKAVGIRVVSYDEGGPVSFGMIVGRRVWLNFLIGQLCGFYGLLDALVIFGSERRCIHDYLAGTKVIEAHTYEAR